MCLLPDGIGLIIALLMTTSQPQETPGPKDIAAMTAAPTTQPTPSQQEKNPSKLLEDRKALDATVWHPEVVAQIYENTF